MRTPGAISYDLDFCWAALPVLPLPILATAAVRKSVKAWPKSSAAFRVHAVAMELRLWCLLAVVAAVFLAAGHLAATRGMGAIVLIGLCVRHIMSFKSLSNARRAARIDLHAARWVAGAWPTRNSTYLSTEPPLESFEWASKLSIESPAALILQYRVR